MSKQDDVLLVMRVVGILFIVNAIILAVRLIICSQGAVCAQQWLYSMTISDAGSLLWYFEIFTVFSIEVVVGIGLVMKRNWGRVLFLGIAPMNIGYGYVAYVTHGTSLKYMLPLIVFTGLLVMYFMNKSVRGYLKHARVSE